jgi:hypothetical protein
MDDSRCVILQSGPAILCAPGTKLDLGWTNRMNCSKNKRELPNVGLDVRPRRSMMLCSLQRTFPGAALCDGAGDSEPFARSELLMARVAALGLRADVRESLYQQLVDEGCCQLLDIVL